ncbi:MAG TPA: ABC-type transport auxiliary lipoprotein family protein [Kofleriaceae bacterium]|nr:ABC-type transport auxiliary lipoprotein family protein [Kofleriaceae bacterium]
MTLFVLLAACAGKVPETRYYQLATQHVEPSDDGSGVTLVVEPLETESAYDDDRIVYRLTPYRLDYYDYHRWSAAPGTLIGNFLEQAFEASGRFRTVTREATSDAPVTLGGRVIALEEVDTSKTQWVGHVVVELTLTENATGKVVWSQQYEETEPLPKQSPEGLAEALSKALERIAARALPVISDRAVQIARSSEAAKATASRAARSRP